MYNPDDHEKAAVLEERIEAAIAAGIRRGQAEKARRRVLFRRRIGGAAVACVLLFSCILTIRVSPVFAAFVRDIPGFGKFVDLIRDTQDRGIQLAVDNDFVQPVGVSDEHDGMKFTVQGIIVDDSRMVLFYDIAIPGKEEYVRFDQPRLTDASGKALPAMISYRYPQEEKQNIRKSGLQRGTVDFNLMQDSALPDEVLLKAQLKRTGMPEIDYQVKFRIDRAKFAGLRHEYALGQTVDVEGQKVTFSKAVVSPLKVSLYLDYGAANAKQIFGPDDIRLVDDEGKEWKNFSGSLEKDHPVYHFESPYFNEPKSLYVEGRRFRALDKNKLKVTVDTEKREFLQRPDDQLSLGWVVSDGEPIKLDFKLHGIERDDHTMYNSLFEPEFADAAGRTYKAADFQGASASFESSQPNQQHVYYYLDKASYKQPLTFTISNYPQYIRQPYKIRIK